MPAFLLKPPVFIQSCASIVSQKEGEGPLGSCFDSVSSDPLFGSDTWEAAESTMQKKAAALAIEKAGLDFSQIRLLFAGDLLAQTVASSFGTADLGIPFYGLFGACSTMGESPVSGSPVHRSRLRTAYPLCNLQSFRKCGKRISVSSGIWKSKTLICYLDCHRCRSLHTWVQPSRPSCSRRIKYSAKPGYLRSHYRHHHRKTDRFRPERFF